MKNKKFDLERIHPELRAAFKRMPALPLHNRLFLKLAKLLMKIIPVPKGDPSVAIETRQLQSNSVRIYCPAGTLSGAGLLWIHGGGLIIGSPAQDDRTCAALARDLKLVVVSVKYRLAPEHLFPDAIDDCFAAWQWLQHSARDLGIDPTRIAVSGQSAGGGLAACLAQRILQGGGVQPAAQALFCPMLDDRTATRHELDTTDYPLWTNHNNRTAWTWYLGQPAGATTVPPFAAAARCENLAGLPPTWLSVGDIELFYDEVRHYAERLQQAGVRCHLHVASQAPHAFESMVPNAPVSRALWASIHQFLSESLVIDNQRVLERAVSAA